MKPSTIISLIFAGLSALLVGWAVVVVLEWRAASQQLPVVQKKLKETLSYIKSSEELQRDVTQGYLDEMAKLRDGANKPPRVIRVCDKPVPPRPATPVGTDGPAPAPGPLPEEPGRDIGPQLYAKADEADRLSAQLRSLQDYVRRIRNVEQN